MINSNRPKRKGQPRATRDYENLMPSTGQIGGMRWMALNDIVEEVDRPTEMVYPTTERLHGTPPTDQPEVIIRPYFLGKDGPGKKVTRPRQNPGRIKHATEQEGSVDQEPGLIQLTCPLLHGLTKNQKSTPLVDCKSCLGKFGDNCPIKWPMLMCKLCE